MSRVRTYLNFPGNTAQPFEFYRPVFGGEDQQCGWLKDRFGISWQIIPEQLSAMLSDPVTGPEVQKAFLKMKKFDLGALLKIASGN